MIKTLYNCFQHWSENGSVFIYSDPHFDDSDCRYMDPNWPSSEAQVDKINNIVKKNDCLILLGDIGNIDYISKLKAGYKVLITGNHDTGVEHYKRIKSYNFCTDKTSQEIKESNPNAINIHYVDPIAVFYDIDNKLFDEVYSGPLMISDKIILSHEPIPNINWALNICGHDHSGKCNDKYHYCVCSNTIDYTPVNLKNIINSGLLKQIDSLHRITIDKAAENPIKRDER